MAERPLPSYDGDETYIFVTYSHKDSDLVYPQIRWLQDQGFSVAWDEGISPGAKWRSEIAQAIRGCSLLVYFMTPNSVASDHCNREVHFALDELQLPVLAVHLEETALPDALALSLSDRQAILQHALDPREYERKLVSSVASYLGQSPASVSARTRMRRSSRRPSWLVTIACSTLVGGLAALGTWVAMRSESPSSPNAARFEVQLPPGSELATGGSTRIGIDRAGARIFVLADSAQGVGVLVRDLDTPTFSALEGTRGTNGRLIGLLPSPNGETIGLAYADGMFRRMPAAGGVPRDIMKTENHSLSFHFRWESDSMLLLQDGSSIKRVNMEDPAEINAFSLVDSFAAHPQASPDGNALVYTERKPSETPRIRIKSLATGQDNPLIEGSDPRVTPSHHLLFYRDGSVWATQLDVPRLAVTGKPFVVLTEVAAEGGKAQYEFAESGTLVYQPQHVQKRHKLVLLSREGVERKVLSDNVRLGQLSVAPDRSRVAYASGSLFRSELQALSLESGLVTRLAPAAIGVSNPVWLPNDRGIVFSRYHEAGKTTLSLANPQTNETRTIYRADRVVFARAHTPDGGTLLVDICESETPVGCDIGVLPIDRPQDAYAAIDSTYNEYAPSVSPDGSYLAYSTDQYGPRRIVVRSLDNLQGAYTQVPKDDCTYAHWSAKEDELFISCEDGLFAFPIEDLANLRLGDPTYLFASTVGQVRYDPTRQQFLAITKASSLNTIVVVVNWFSELEALSAAAQP